MSNFDFASVLIIIYIWNQLMRSYVLKSFFCEKIVDNKIYVKTRNKIHVLFVLFGFGGLYRFPTKTPESLTALQLSITLFMSDLCTA